MITLLIQGVVTSFTDRIIWWVTFSSTSISSTSILCRVTAVNGFSDRSTLSVSGVHEPRGRLEAFRLKTLTEISAVCIFMHLRRVPGRWRSCQERIPVRSLFLSPVAWWSWSLMGSIGPPLSGRSTQSVSLISGTLAQPRLHWLVWSSFCGNALPLSK